MPAAETDEQRGRRRRKSHRQLRNAFVPQPCRIHRWRWYDIAFAIFAVVFMIYAIICLSVTSGNIKIYRRLNDPTVSQQRNRTVEDEIRAAYCFEVLISFAVSLIMAQIYLIIAMADLLMWLRYFRNIGYFIILGIVILIGIIFFLTIGFVGWYKYYDEVGFESLAYRIVTNNFKLHNKTNINYEIKLLTFQNRNLCCGMRDYRDWKVWNVLALWPRNLDYVPVECCKNHSRVAEVSFLKNECGNMEILKEKANSVKLNNIIVHGCSKRIMIAINEDRQLIFYIFNGLVVGILLSIFLFVFMLLMCKFFLTGNLKKSGGDGFYDPREQEDELESAIVPGTPAKSMMSESENTFYAP